MRVKYIYKKLFPWALECLQKDGFRCRKCGSNKSLIVHHIDGSRKCGRVKMNNCPGNLVTLCRPCHAEAHGIGLQFKRADKNIIMELRKHRKTYQEIGDYLGISRQRVHQLLKILRKRKRDLTAY